MNIVIPEGFTREHQQVLTQYLTDARVLTTAAWQQLYQAIELLKHAQVIINDSSRSFHQLYQEHIDRPFADAYIDQLLQLEDVPTQAIALTATFARQINPLLQKVGLLERQNPQSWLLLVYSVYSWQSFARGYAFEVEIMRDLERSRVAFKMHDIRRRVERYTPADILVAGLRGDIKTSTYFLQKQPPGPLTNDFYITRVYERGYNRTLVVFQKPVAWEMLGGGETVPGRLDNILALLPRPVRLNWQEMTLIVIDYETWKERLRRR